MKRTLGFAGVSLVLILGLAWMLTLYWPDPTARQAIWFSAGVALAVQVVGFVFVRVLMPANMLAGWGAGLLLRFLTLVFHALVGTKVMGYPPAPALMSLAAFFFVSTLVEPVFLTS